MKFVIFFFCFLIQTKLSFLNLDLDFLSSFSLAFFTKRKRLFLPTLSFFIKDILELNLFPYTLLIFCSLLFFKKRFLKDIYFYLAFFGFECTLYLFKNIFFPFYYYLPFNIALTLFLRKYV